MKTEIKNRMEMIGGVVEFARVHNVAAPGSHLESCFAELQDVKEKLRAAAGRQSGAHRGFRQHATRRAAASAALHQWMADLATVARSLRVDQYPGVAARFRMPRSQSYAEQQAAAGAFIKTLRELQEVFAPRGFGEDSIAEAEAIIAQIEAANGAKISRFLTRIENTELLRILSSRGLAIVREIDAILQRQLRATPALLAEWNFASHVRRPRKKRAAKSTKPASPAAAPSRAEAPQAPEVCAPASAEVSDLAPAASTPSD